MEPSLVWRGNHLSVTKQSSLPRSLQANREGETIRYTKTVATTMITDAIPTTIPRRQHKPDAGMHLGPTNHHDVTRMKNHHWFIRYFYIMGTVGLLFIMIILCIRFLFWDRCIDDLLFPVVQDHELDWSREETQLVKQLLLPFCWCQRPHDEQHSNNDTHMTYHSVTVSNVNEDEDNDDNAHAHKEDWMTWSLPYHSIREIGATVSATVSATVGAIVHAHVREGQFWKDWWKDWWWRRCNPFPVITMKLLPDLVGSALVSFQQALFWMDTMMMMMMMKTTTTSLPAPMCGILLLVWFATIIVFGWRWCRWHHHQHRLQQLEDKIQNLECKVRAMEMRLFLPAHEMAERVIVRIVHSSIHPDQESIMGHGFLLLRFENNNNNNQKKTIKNEQPTHLNHDQDDSSSQFHLITAGHVAIRIAKTLQRRLRHTNNPMDNPEHHDKIYLQSVGNPSTSKAKLVIEQLGRGALFLAKDYVCWGDTCDIGALKVSCRDDESIEPNTDHFYRTCPVKITNKMCDQELCSQSMFCTIQGKALETVLDDRYFMYSAFHPGCEGCPLFTRHGELAAILHGLSTDRGTKPYTKLPSPSSTLDRVLVDRLQTVKLHKVNLDYLDALVHAERYNHGESDSLSNVTENQKVLSAIRSCLEMDDDDDDDDASDGHSEDDHHQSLEELMKILATKCFHPGESPLAFSQECAALDWSSN